MSSGTDPTLPSDPASDETLAASSAERARARSDHPMRGDVGPYRVGAELARGGMGRILVARDLRLDRDVALKELASEDQHLVARFEREIRVTARLQHPGIVPVYEAGRWPDGRPFFAMKLVAGRSLAKAVEERPTLEARLALLPNIVQLVEAMAYAHGRGVLHRDLKPANVLVGSFGETVVIDWGLAREGDEDDAPPADTHASNDDTGHALLTVHGDVIGTPAYMPPEQALGQAVDARADVYALGALLWHVLVGRPPYVGHSQRATLDAVIAGPPPPLARAVAGAPPELIAIVERAMDRDPERRYASARELAIDLERFQTGKLVSSHAYTIGQLAARWARRHRTAVVASTILVACAFIVVGFAVRSTIRERDLAQKQLRALLADRGRTELVAGRPMRASVYLARAYAAGEVDVATRLMLAEAMRSVDLASAPFPTDGDFVELRWVSGVERLIGLDRAGNLSMIDLGQRVVAPIPPPTDTAIGPPQAFAVTADGRYALLAHPYWLFALRLDDLQWRRIPSAGLLLATAPTGASLATAGPDGVDMVDLDRAEPPRRISASPTLALSYAAGGDLQVVEAARVRIINPRDGGTVRETALEAPTRVGAACPGLVLAVPGETTPILFDESGAALSSNDVPTAPRWSCGRGPGRALLISDGSGLGNVDARLLVASAPTSVVLRALSVTEAPPDDGGRAPSLRAVAMSPDGRTIVGGSEGGDVLWWNGTDGGILHRLDGHAFGVQAVAIDAVRTATVDEAGVLRVWDTSRLVASANLGQAGAVSESGVLVEGTDLVVARPGTSPLRLTGHEEVVTWFDGPGDGDRLTAAGRDGRVLQWDTSSGAIVNRWEHGAAVVTGAVEPAARARVVTGGFDGVARIWTDGMEQSIVLGGHTTPVQAIAWSSSGRWLATGAEASVRVWDHLGQLQRHLDLSPSTVTRMRWHDDRVIVVETGQGIQAWDVARGVALVKRASRPNHAAPTLAGESRPSSVVQDIVARNVSWRLAGEVLVPANEPDLGRASEPRSVRSMVWDFTGDTIEGAASTPATPLDLETSDSTSATIQRVLDALRTGRREEAINLISTVARGTNGTNDRALAWCHHWIGHDQLAFDIIAPHALTTPEARADAIRFASAIELDPDQVLTRLVPGGGLELELAALDLADAYVSRSRYDLALDLLAPLPPATSGEARRARAMRLAWATLMLADPQASVAHLADASRDTAEGAPPEIEPSRRCTDVPLLAPSIAPSLGDHSVVEMTLHAAAWCHSTYVRVRDHRYALAADHAYTVLEERLRADPSYTRRCRDELARERTVDALQPGDVNKAQLRRAMRAQVGALQGCYERALDTAPGLQVQMHARFQVSSRGDVTAVVTSTPEPTDVGRGLERCVRDALLRIRLPRMWRLATTAVNYPLSFRPTAPEPPR